MKSKILQSVIPFLLLGFFGYSQEVDTRLTRTIDGSFNNLTNTDWGAAGTNLLRFTDNGYSDEISTLAGDGKRPNPREISNIVFAQEGNIPDPNNLSDFCWVFGQFIDHDFGLTPDGSEPTFVEVPGGDAWFDPFRQGSAVIPMMRNQFDPSTGTNASNPRQHPNLITSFIDGSGVYGSDEERATWLRTFEGGKLKTSAGNQLPYNTDTGELDGEVDEHAPEMDDAVGLTDKLFVAGDVRANENPLLLSFHLLFVREHNRLCDELALANPDWNDEQLYQHARRMVGGFIQSITYNEWLPAMGVDLGSYEGYKEDVNPSLLNVFTAAAFRLGHTLLNGNLLLLGEGNDIEDGGFIPLRDVFFNSQSLPDIGIENFLRGMAAQTQQSFDAKLVDDVRNFLFGPPGAGGLDLASININRGRERGLPDYNTVRENFGLKKYRVFPQINPDVTVSTRLMIKYLSVNWVDPWVGMLAEQPMPGKLFGETVNAIMEYQFRNLRDGDRFYYLNDPVLSEDEKNTITQTRFRDIIIRNTDIELLQVNVFKATNPGEVCPVMEEMAVEVTTEEGLPIPGVETTIQMTNDAKVSVSDESGVSTLGEIPSCEVATLQLNRNGDAGNGLSTLDVIIAQKHILGVQLLDSPYKLLAADVNQSESISTIDLINMRKVILGIEPTFSSNQVWKFVPAAYQFPDPNEPFEEIISNNQMTFSDNPNTYYKFIGVKLGDLNGSAEMAIDNEALVTRNDEQPIVMTVADNWLETGEVYDITFTIENFASITGYQFGLEYDEEAIKVLGLSSATIPGFGEDNYGLFSDRGYLTSSWNTTLPTAVKEGVFTLSVEVLNSTQLKNSLALQSQKINNEAYDENLVAKPLQLDFEQKQSPLNGFQVYQNHPNPFVDRTQIAFQAVEAGQVTLKVYNQVGQMLYQTVKEVIPGIQVFNLRKEDIKENGLLIYKVETATEGKSLKMLAVDQ